MSVSEVVDSSKIPSDVSFRIQSKQMCVGGMFLDILPFFTGSFRTVGHGTLGRSKPAGRQSGSGTGRSSHRVPLESAPA